MSGIVAEKYINISFREHILKDENRDHEIVDVFYTKGGRLTEGYSLIKREEFESARSEYWKTAIAAQAGAIEVDAVGVGFHVVGDVVAATIREAQDSGLDIRQDELVTFVQQEAETRLGGRGSLVLRHEQDSRAEYINFYVIQKKAIPAMSYTCVIL